MYQKCVELVNFKINFTKKKQIDTDRSISACVMIIKKQLLTVTCCDHGFQWFNKA